MRNHSLHKTVGRTSTDKLELHLPNLGNPSYRTTNGMLCCTRFMQLCTGMVMAVALNTKRRLAQLMFNKHTTFHTQRLGEGLLQE
jgi:hypothetical protein